MTYITFVIVCLCEIRCFLSLVIICFYEIISTYIIATPGFSRYSECNKVVMGGRVTKEETRWDVQHRVKTCTVQVAVSPLVSKRANPGIMVSTDQTLSQDVVFELLSSPRRRYVLYLLRDADEPVELTTLAEHVAAWENDTSVDDITEQERKRVYVSLYQTHIPRLDDANVVNYDKESGLVSLATDAKEIDSYLDSSEEDVQWEWIYLVLAGLGALALGLTVLEAPLFAALSVSAVAGVVIGFFVVTAIVHTLYRLREGQNIPTELQERL